jgi:tetratricopeptide (TPR) repeat protein
MSKIMHGLFAATICAAIAIPGAAQDMRDTLTDRPERQLPAEEGAAQAPEARPEVQAPKRKARRNRRSRKSASRARAGRTVITGIRAMKEQNYSKAIVIFERAAKQDSRWSNAFFHLGNAYYHRAFAQGSPETADRDDASNAIDAFETALALDPALRSIRQPHKLYHGLAQSYEAVGRYDEALASIKDGAAVSPRNPMPNLYGARLRYRMRDFVMSSKNFYVSVARAHKIKSYPQLSKLIRSNGLFVPLLSVPQNRVILDAFDAVTEGTLSLAEARERIKTGDTGGMRDALADRPSASVQMPQVVKRPEPRQDPDVLKAIELGHLAFNVRRYREAVKHYENAFALDRARGTMDSVQKSMLFERIGSSYRKLGLANEAVQVLERAVGELPDNSTAYYQLALANAQMGKVGDAMSHLNRSLETARSMSELRKTLLMTKTDTEFEGLYDLPRFADIVKSFERKIARR